MFGVSPDSFITLKRKKNYFFNLSAIDLLKKFLIRSKLYQTLALLLVINKGLLFMGEFDKVVAVNFCKIEAEEVKILGLNY